jgi:ribosomal protein S14
MKAESGGYVNKTSFRVYISGAPAGHGSAAPGIGRRRQPKHEIPESGQCRVTGRRPKHEIPESGLSRIAGRRAAPVIVRPDTAAGSPDSRHCLRQKAGTSHCGRPEPGYRIRLQGPDAGIADTRIPEVQFLQTPRTDCPPPETGRKGQAKITPKVFRVDFGNILKKFTWNFVFSDKIHTFVPTTAYMAIFHHIHHHHHHFPKG